ncbi:hypothetical protein GpartN1_g7343.t1 [Galdieria partita]|uniref:Major facilitator superfamily (MFS) profile domain-containing protein n=1 Tax=Galdieria partita TaxID=83374 RepID=A0A9C7Q6B3_9RHOD|nr:hypothetical protein GpartN1_g7343.t1 [Galdieria partita]
MDKDLEVSFEAKENKYNATWIENLPGMETYRSILHRGASLYRQRDFNNDDELTDEERAVLKKESHNRWMQPFSMYYLCAVSAMAAIAQGMDETVINGAQIYFHQEFGIESRLNIQGLVNAIPFLICACVASWASVPLNEYLGRRGAIFVASFLSAAASIWEALSPSWQMLLGGRIVLGMAIGINAATAPVYSAEGTPPSIRGGLVMWWQTFTAFGIMIGYIMDVAFMDVHYPLNWRLMLGSTVVAPILVMIMVVFSPESPRWLIKKKKYRQAFESLKRLRNLEVQAARDFFLIEESVEEERKAGMVNPLELFTVPRNRRAALAAWIVMYMQQFCGVNVIMYYSSVIFTQTGVSTRDAILASLGAGVLNFLFALPAIPTIDRWGRRPLLLWTFPLMSIFLLFSGFSFWAHSSHTRLGLVAAGIYLFMIVYSPGEGPVPFTYSSEVFPLYIRTWGMSFATATTWMFSFVLSFSWPDMLKRFTPQGAFGWYAAWCIVGEVLIFFFVPETKGYTLEELDVIFGKSTREHMSYQIRNAKRSLKKLFGGQVGPKEAFCNLDTLAA